MLWNQRRRYAVLLLEQMLVFIAVALSLTIAYDTIRSYNTPGQIDAEDIVSFGYMISGDFNSRKSGQSINAMDVVKEKLRQKPYVAGICESFYFTPYLRPSDYYWADSLIFTLEKKFFVHIKATDEMAEKVFNPDIIQGRWFRDGERIDGKHPAIVSEQLVRQMGLTAPVGKTINLGSIPCVITGVISGIKEDPMEDAPSSIIVPIGLVLPTGSTGTYEELTAKLLPGYEDEFTNDFYREFNRVMDSDIGAECFICPLSQSKSERMEERVLSMATTGIPAFFFLLFTIIGIAGMNLMEAKDRLKEFALRLSCGSTKKMAVCLVVIQNTVVTVLSAIPGISIILSIYPAGISLPVAAVTLALAIFISFLCAMYPAFGILRMNPVAILKEE